jgi:hypothetical protein
MGEGFYFYPDIAIVHASLQAKSFVGGVVGDVFRQERPIASYDGGRGGINLFNRTGKMLVKLIPPKPDGSGVGVIQRRDKTGDNHDRPAQEQQHQPDRRFINNREVFYDSHNVIVRAETWWAMGYNP